MAKPAGWGSAVGVVLLLTMASGVRADQAEGERLFALAVEGVFVQKCLACHGDDPDQLRGGLDMRSRSALVRGGESGQPAIVPGRSADSLLVEAIRWEGYEMPPKQNDRLSDTQIAAIARWIDLGAPWPEGPRIAELRQAAESAESASGVLVATSGGLSEAWTQRRYDPTDLWAYQPLGKVEPPAGADHPIDAFLEARLNAAELTAAPPADRRTLIRRLTYDLTGLPPTPEEVARFVKDPDPGAYERLVERLLASPHYGERMAQHWLDVVRYADSDGFSNDFDRPAAWRYRDYVVRSFQNDKPYDQFLVEQIAGDELDDTQPEHLIAVGFLRMGPWEHTAMSVAAETRQQWLDDVTNTVGVTFLATEMSCFKCHDHKFDPLPTRDYYRMQAAFATTQFTFRRVDFLENENTTGLDAHRRRIEALLQDDGINAVLPGGLSDEQRDELLLGVKKVRSKQKQLYQRQLLRSEPLALSVYSGPDRTYHSPRPAIGLPDNRRGRPTVTHLLTGGALDSPAEPVTPGVLSLLAGGLAETSPADLPEGMVGRRLALARWMARADNPLVPRVMVNRIWQMHFDRGLAGNPNNFGKMGAKPTHPELLDWLAHEFVNHGWSVKHLHRLIVTSAAYRRASSHPDPDRLAKADPELQLCAVFRPRRLSAEELRDTMLVLSGELNRQLGGPPAAPEINLEVAMQPRHTMGSVAPAYQPDPTPDARHRRTLYAIRIRTLADPLLEVFDKPGSETSCEARESSTVTPQVFSLFNSQFSHDRALAWALRLERDADTPAERIAMAFELAYGRGPTDDERGLCQQHYDRMLAHHREHQPVAVEPPRFIEREMVEEMTGTSFRWRERLDVYASDAWTPDPKPWDVGPATRALAEICLVLLNTNELLTLD